VLEIIFPGDFIDTPAGKINIIAGQGVAKIEIRGESTSACHYADAVASWARRSSPQAQKTTQLYTLQTRAG
jgi:hypothetical protein